MAYIPPHEIGSTHKNIPAAKSKLQRAYKSYSDGVDDGTNIYTERLGEVLLEFRRRVNIDVEAGKRRPPMITEPDAETGLVPFDWTVQDQLGLIAASSPAPVREFRNIWFYSAPGSGAPWWVGPSFQVGKWCEDVLKLNHQPIGYPIGGYLGLMGGDPGLSYNEVIESQYVELKRLLDTNPHVQEALHRVTTGGFTNIEFWFSGYSQSADGMEDALVKLFGDGGPYASLRSRINGVIQFGNPSKRDTGIARKKRPEWLYALVRNITTKGDFYAEAPDNIRPLFYAEIVRAESSLPFGVHVMMIALPVVLNFFGSIFGLGGLLGGLFSSPVFGLLKGQADEAEHEEVDRKLIELLTLKGILSNIPALIGLLAALPGIQTHGEYHLPKPEFNHRTGEDVGKEIVAAFRR